MAADILISMPGWQLIKCLSTIPRSATFYLTIKTTSPSPRPKSNSKIVYHLPHFNRLSKKKAGLGFRTVFGVLRFPRLPPSSPHRSEDGIHYDALALAKDPQAPEAEDVTVFPAGADTSANSPGPRDQRQRRRRRILGWGGWGWFLHVFGLFFVWFSVSAWFQLVIPDQVPIILNPGTNPNEANRQDVNKPSFGSSCFV